MRSLTKKFYTPRTFDVLFAFAGLVGVIGLARVAGLPEPAIAAAENPGAKAGAVIGTLLGSAALSTLTARFDQKMADDFLFHTLTKSAFIAMTTIICALAFWHALLADNLGGLTEGATIGIIVAAWSLCYFYVRLRGTGA